ncbi:MAG: vWA domain-containing protein [Candidatus Kariarchaeaceae archaeon]|jgi:predicted metal-dependent peptidase
MIDDELPKSIKQFFNIDSTFEKDDSPEGEFEAVRLSQARSSLYLDMPFFGYILGNLEIFPVSDVRIPAYAADTRRIYINPEFTSDKANERLKGILMHLVTHLILKHGERMNRLNGDVWNISSDVTTRIVVNESHRLLIDDQEASSSLKGNFGGSIIWEIDPIDNIPKLLRNSSSDYVYKTLYDYAQSLVGIKEDDQTSSIKSSEFSEKVMDEVLNYSGIDSPCSFGLAMEEMYLGLDEDLSQLESGRFDGVVRSAWFQGKERGVLPGAMKEVIDQLINPVLPWQVLLLQYIQHTLMSDWRWVPANRRMISMDIHLPSTIKEHINIVVAVDTSGSISSQELTSFVTETHSILSSFSSVRMILIDCDTKVQQVLVIEDGQSIDGSPLPWEGRPFKGRGGTAFYPVFDWVRDKGEIPDILIYFTDGYGTFPSNDQDFPVLWVMTTDLTPPFGDHIRYEEDP